MKLLDPKDTQCPVCGYATYPTTTAGQRFCSYCRHEFVAAGYPCGAEEEGMHETQTHDHGVPRLSHCPQCLTLLGLLGEDVDRTMRLCPHCLSWLVVRETHQGCMLVRWQPFLDQGIDPVHFIAHDPGVPMGIALMAARVQILQAQADRTQERVYWLVMLLSLGLMSLAAMMMVNRVFGG